MIPFSPQPIDRLKERFKTALSKSYSVSSVTDGKTERPGTKPEHVFDFENGIRLIISRDYHNGEEYIHVSGSFDPGIYKRKVGSPLLIRMQMAYIEIRGEVIKFPRPIYSKGGIPHWLIPHSNQN
jgi:hypothetical protein